MKGGSEYHFLALIFHLGQWSNITPFLPKTYRDYINLILKSCQKDSSVMSCMWGELERRHLVADIEELEQMDASELHARRLNCKGSVNAAHVTTEKEIS